MVRDFNQVDAAAPDGSIAACTSLAVARNDYDREVSAVGTLGSGTNIVGADTNTEERGIHFESAAGEPGQEDWPAGTWSVRINITTGNTNLNWTSTTICRVDSGGTSQGTIGTDGTNGNFTAGLALAVFSGSADSGAESDRFYIIVGVARLFGQHGTQNATITNDEVIRTPFASLQIQDRGIMRGHMRGVGRGI